MKTANPLPDPGHALTPHLILRDAARAIDWYVAVFGAVEEFRAAKSAARRTPRYPSHMARNAGKRVAEPERVPDERYNTRSYAHAVTRGVRKANRPLIEAAVDVELHVPHWHPNQLRHTHATEVRKRYGLEAAQVALGHERADVTQVYAERDLAMAVRVAAEAG